MAVRTANRKTRMSTRDFRHPRKPIGHQPQQQIDTPQAREEADRAARQRQHAALDEDTRDDHAKREAPERTLHRRPPARAPPREPAEIGDVGDGNQHHEHDPAHQHQQGRTDAGHQIGAERRHARRPTKPRGVIIRVLARNRASKRSRAARARIRRRRRRSAGRSPTA